MQALSSLNELAKQIRLDSRKIEIDDSSGCDEDDIIRNYHGSFRLAEAGEFTKRAFLNDKLDLTQVEGLADLMNAETEQQRAQAVRQMDGVLGRLYLEWRQEIIGVLAYCEAIIDFAEDEEDVGEEQILANVLPRVEALRQSLEMHLADQRRGEILRNGVDVAIVGAPNVGKSTLLNTLSQRDAAIVSNIPGTTRDIVEVAMDLGGYPVRFADTAGIRETVDKVEREGVRRARKRVAEADLKVIVFDGSPLLRSGFDDIDWSHLDEESLELVDDDCVVVFSKMDELSNDTRRAVKKAALDFFNDRNQNPLSISLLSCHTGVCVQDFVDTLRNEVSRRLGRDTGSDEAPLITRARHREHVNECFEYVQAFQHFYQWGDLVLAAEQLRQASRSLGRIVGVVDVDELLDVIFNDFCIGK